MSTNNWVRDSSTDKLRQIRVGYPPHTVEHRAADEELRRREAEEAKRESRELEHREQQRHQELVSAQKNDKNRADDPWYKKPVGIIIIGLTVTTIGFIVRAALMRYCPQWFK